MDGRVVSEAAGPPVSKPVVHAGDALAEAESPGPGTEIDRFVSSEGLAASRDP